MYPRPGYPPPPYQGAPPYAAPPYSAAMGYGPQGACLLQVASAGARKWRRGTVCWRLPRSCNLVCSLVFPAAGAPFAQAFPPRGLPHPSAAPPARRPPGEHTFCAHGRLAAPPRQGSKVTACAWAGLQVLRRQRAPRCGSARLRPRWSHPWRERCWKRAAWYESGSLPPTTRQGGSRALGSAPSATQRVCWWRCRCWTT